MTLVATEGRLLIKLEKLERTRAYLRIEYAYGSPNINRVITGRQPSRLELGDTIVVHNIVQYHDMEASDE